MEIKEIIEKGLASDDILLQGNILNETGSGKYYELEKLGLFPDNTELDEETKKEIEKTLTEQVFIDMKVLISQDLSKNENNINIQNIQLTPYVDFEDAEMRKFVSFVNHKNQHSNINLIQIEIPVESKLERNVLVNENNRDEKHITNDFYITVKTKNEIDNIISYKVQGDVKARLIDHLKHLETKYDVSLLNNGYFDRNYCKDEIERRGLNFVNTTFKTGEYELNEIKEESNGSYFREEDIKKKNEIDSGKVDHTTMFDKEIEKLKPEDIKVVDAISEFGEHFDKTVILEMNDKLLRKCNDKCKLMYGMELTKESESKIMVYANLNSNKDFTANLYMKTVNGEVLPLELFEYERHSIYQGYKTYEMNKEHHFKSEANKENKHIEQKEEFTLANIPIAKKDDLIIE